VTLTVKRSKRRPTPAPAIPGAEIALVHSLR
jgi:hypothetical protein